MAQAQKNRKQWRPKAVIEQQAAQHRSNADNLVTAYYQEKQSNANPPSIVPDKTSLTLPIDINETLSIDPKALETQCNSLMLKLSTSVLSPACYSTPTKRSSSSVEQNEDEECDDVALFIPHEQTNGKKNIENDNQIEILSSNNNNNNNISDVIQFKTKNCSSQTDDDHHLPKRTKTRLKTNPNADSSAVAAAVQTSTNNVKIAKRKAYSRMKKERKATQTLIIVLSKLK